MAGDDFEVETWLLLPEPAPLLATSCCAFIEPGLEETWSVWALELLLSLSFDWAFSSSWSRFLTQEPHFSIAAEMFVLGCKGDACLVTLATVGPMLDLDDFADVQRFVLFTEDALIGCFSIAAEGRSWTPLLAALPRSSVETLVVVLPMDWCLKKTP